MAVTLIEELTTFCAKRDAIEKIDLIKKFFNLD